MKLEFDRYSSEALDEIFNAILIEDWRNVREECKRIKKRIKEETQSSEWRHACEEDLEHNKKIRKAYETIIRYCLSYEKANELLGEEKCKGSGL